MTIWCVTISEIEVSILEFCFDWKIAHIISKVGTHEISFCMCFICVNLTIKLYKCNVGWIEIYFYIQQNKNMNVTKK